MKQSLKWFILYTVKVHKSSFHGIVEVDRQVQKFAILTSSYFFKYFVPTLACVHPLHLHPL